MRLFSQSLTPSQTERMNRPAPKLSLKIVLPILSVYCCISVLGLYYHELFLDEAHHFLMSRDSPSLADLYYNLRYDGHPRLWGVLLYFITHYLPPLSFSGMARSPCR